MEVKSLIEQFSIWIGIVASLVSIILVIAPLIKWFLKKYYQQNHMVRPHKLFKFLKHIFGDRKAPIEIYKFPHSKKQ